MAGQCARHQPSSPRHGGMEQSASYDQREQRATDVTGDHDLDTRYTKKHAFEAPPRSPRSPGAGPDQECDRRSKITSARVISLDGRVRRQNARPTAARRPPAPPRAWSPGAPARHGARSGGSADGASATCLVPMRSPLASAGHALCGAGRRCFAGPVTAASVTPAAGELRSGPCCPAPPRCARWDRRRCRRVPRRGASTTGLRPACSGGSSRLDMTSQRAPRRARAGPRRRLSVHRPPQPGAAAPPSS